MRPPARPRCLDPVRLQCRRSADRGQGVERLLSKIGQSGRGGSTQSSGDRSKERQEAGPLVRAFVDLVVEAEDRAFALGGDVSEVLPEDVARAGGTADEHPPGQGLVGGPEVVVGADCHPLGGVEEESWFEPISIRKRRRTAGTVMPSSSAAASTSATRPAGRGPTSSSRIVAPASARSVITSIGSSSSGPTTPARSRASAAANGWPKKFLFRST